MKLTITKKNLLEVLAPCVPLAKQKTPLPVLSCVLLKADLELTASATDLYQSVVARTSADISAPGQAAVNAKDLLARVQTYPDGPLSLSVDESHLHLTTGKRKHKIPIVDAVEFPSIVSELAQGLTLPGKQLATLLAMSRPAAREDADRAAMHSVVLELRDGQISTYATDGHHMHFATEPLEHGSPSTCIIPLASVDAILAILDKSKDATVSTTATDLLLRSGAVVYSTRLVADHFPPVRDMLTRIGPRACQVDRETLASALRSVSLASADGALSGIVSLDFAQDELTITSEGKGTSSDTIPLLSPVATPLTLSLQSSLLLSALPLLPPTITLHTDDDLSPVYLTAPGHPLTALVMPCRR